MTPERFARLKQALARRQHNLTVLADGVHKSHNISAHPEIARRCRANGVAYAELEEDGALRGNPFDA